MIDPQNIKELSYDFLSGNMIIQLNKQIVIENRSRNEVYAKCSYDKFKQYVNKWNSVKLG